MKRTADLQFRVRVPQPPMRIMPLVMYMPGTKPERRPAPAVLSEAQREALERFNEAPAVRRMRQLRKIEREVAAAYHIPIAILWSQERSDETCLARQEAHFRLRYETTMSLPRIGERCGHRNHTTVLHGIRKIAQMINQGWRMRSRPDVIGVGPHGYITPETLAPAAQTGNEQIAIQLTLFEWLANGADRLQEDLPRRIFIARIEGHDLTKVGVCKDPDQHVRKIAHLSPFQVCLTKAFDVCNLETAQAVVTNISHAMKPHKTRGGWFSVSPLQTIEAVERALMSISGEAK